MTYQFHRVEIKDRIAILTVTREKALNALNADLLREMCIVLEELAKNQEIRVLVITGAGDKAFVAGADIAAMSKMDARGAEEFCALGHRTMNTVDKFPRPVIAAVNGFALGGGLELALACDFIYASANAKLGLPEVGLGLYPGFGGSQRLPRLIGKNKARELIFTGRVISAGEALALGIVNKVCPPDQLMAEVLKTADEIGSKGPAAVVLVKRVIHEGTSKDLEGGLNMEKTTFSKCFATEDLKEGLNAFLEKRKPNFNGR